MCLTCRANAAAAATSRRNFLRSVGGVAASLALAPSVFAKDSKPSPKPQNDVPPDAALQRLMKGNDRYAGGTSRRHDFKAEREALVGGQNPYAGILSCADSRIAPEYAFDSSRGDLFVCRVAGNFANDDTIASLEYASAILNSRCFWYSATKPAARSMRRSSRSRTTPPCRVICRRWSAIWLRP